MCCSLSFTASSCKSECFEGCSDGDSDWLEHNAQVRKVTLEKTTTTQSFPPATYNLAKWEHEGKSAGIKFNVIHICDFSSVQLSAVLIIITERHLRHLPSSRWLSYNFLSGCVWAAFDFYASAELIKLMFLSLTNASPTVPLQPSTPEWLFEKENGDLNPANVQESWFLGFRIFVRHNPTRVLLMRTYNGLPGSLSHLLFCICTVQTHSLVYFCVHKFHKFCFSLSKF